MPRVRSLPGQNLPGTIDLGKIAKANVDCRGLGPYGCNRTDLAGGAGRGRLPVIARMSDREKRSLLGRENRRIRKVEHMVKQMRSQKKSRHTEGRNYDGGSNEPVLWGIRYSATPGAGRPCFFRVASHRLPTSPARPGASRSRLGGRGTGAVKLCVASRMTSLEVYSGVKSDA